MKLKRSKFISVFFLISFFVSVSTNIALASIIAPVKNTHIQTKDHLHLNETTVSSVVNDILFEENENENENELDLEFSLVLIPFFLEPLSSHKVTDAFDHSSTSVIPTEQPIYIKVANFRI